jgi:uncharacterized alpha-E superfamily protein
MLSRVAGSLYWMGRYLERAENVSRLLLVTAEDSSDLEGLDEERARREWEDLAEAVPGWRPPDLSQEPEKRAIACIESLLLDPDTPVSVRSALERAGCGIAWSPSTRSRRATAPSSPRSAPSSTP